MPSRREDTHKKVFDYNQQKFDCSVQYRLFEKFYSKFYKYLKILIIRFDQKNPFVSEYSSAFSPLRIKKPI